MTAKAIRTAAASHSCGLALHLLCSSPALACVYDVCTCSLLITLAIAGQSDLAISLCGAKSGVACRWLLNTRPDEAKMPVMLAR